MSDVAVRSPDAEALARKLKSTPFLAEAVMTKAVLVALRHAMKRTPVKTGTLRRSLTTRVEPGGARGWLGTNIRYGAFVHDGTKFMAARPFLAQGISDARPEIDRILDQAGDAYLDKVSR